MTFFGCARLVAAMALIPALSACQGTGPFGTKPGTDAPVQATATRLVERDVEAPDAFQRTETGLWSGTPSFGGVWVAHPDGGVPERVIIRNVQTGKFVIGSLFKRDAQGSGPPFQISSDAAAALGVTPGQPTPLNVTALRREQVPEGSGADSETVEQSASSQPAAAIQTAPLPAAAAQPTPPPAPAAKPAPANSRLPEPYIQIGIFSVKANAEATADRLRGSGVVPTVLEEQSAGKTFWRVIAGPARSLVGRTDLLEKARALGFPDAFAVRN